MAAKLPCKQLAKSEGDLLDLVTYFETMISYISRKCI